MDTGDAGLHGGPGFVGWRHGFSLLTVEEAMSLPKSSSRPNHLSLVVGSGYSKKTDAELVLLCQKHDNAAFEELVRRHQRTVYSLLYKLAPEWTDSADLAQEAFIRIWRGIGKLQNPRSFRSWLTQIVTNIFYDELRKRPRQLPTLSLDQSFESDEEQDMGTRDVKDTTAGPDELCQRKELNLIVQKAMTSLPEQFRTVIVLRELEGLSYEEIAVLTNTDLGTVKSRISRGRTKIQGMLAPYLQSDDIAISA
jgi:RNA polymerase sigma-70 factor, ECF subfamily